MLLPSAPQEFEDIRDKTQKDLERDIATRGAAHTGAQKKGADRMSRYATGDSADEPTSGGLVEHSSEGFALSAPAPAEPAPPAPAPPEPNSPSPPSPSPSAAKTSPPRSPKRASPKAYEDPPEAMLDTLPQAEKTPVVVETKDNLSNKGSDAPAAASDALRDRRPMGKRSNLVSSHQPPPALSAREREKREEEEEEEEMRKRKEQMVKMGEVKRAALVDWKDEDFEVNDDEVEIHMDGQDAILEITSNMSENTQTPNKIVPSADPAVVKPEDEGEDHPYPSESYFAANNITPPKVTYYHARNMLTISFQKAAAAELSFSPPTTLHYKAKDTSVHLPLQEGCKSPKVYHFSSNTYVQKGFERCAQRNIRRGFLGAPEAFCTRLYFTCIVPARKCLWGSRTREPVRCTVRRFALSTSLCVVMIISPSSLNCLFHLPPGRFCSSAPQCE